MYITYWGKEGNKIKPLGGRFTGGKRSD